jgi:hypothetical protein
MQFGYHKESNHFDTGWNVAETGKLLTASIIQYFWRRIILSKPLITLVIFPDAVQTSLRTHALLQRHHVQSIRRAIIPGA